MKKNIKEIMLIIGFITLFIIVHSVYYNNLFVFVHDQVSSSTKALELWKTKSFVLIGPPLSFSIENRQIYFGGLCYYIQLIFLLLGKFDPFWSTYSFMLFSSLMIVPLYFGVKNLINKYAAIIMLTLYSLFPFYIESTHALWNPYFMFSFLPLQVYLISRFNKNKNLILFFAISLLSGMLFQLHYMFIFVLLGLLIYFFLVKKLSWKYLLIFISGIAIGNINLIIFELRHNFYLLKTVSLYLTHPKQVTGHWFADYYLLSETFYGLIIALYIIRNKLSKYLAAGFFILMLIVSIYYVTVGSIEKQYPKNWYYSDELKTYNIIKNNLLDKNINIFEFYNATGDTQKYFLKRDNILINFDNYYTNKYLYVIYKKNSDFMKDAAYEVNSFQPSEVIKQWKINNEYNLFLLKRIIK